MKLTAEQFDLLEDWITKQVLYLCAPDDKSNHADELLRASKNKAYDVFVEGKEP